MSGQSIGTVLGGAIGFAIGGGLGARIGMVIGGAVGSVVKPDVIEGPHVGDGQPQQATDGTAIARVFGTAWVTGTVIDVGPRREVKKEDDGKGGPTQVTYEAHQDFVVLICESDELRGSSIAGVLMVEQDGKIVYDARPGSAISSDSAKFAESVTFYAGDEGQLPPSLVEAIHGAGQNPAYRGVALACFSDFNLTPAGGRIPNFRFLVANASVLIPAQSTYKYLITIDDDGADRSSPSLDDSKWATGRAPFAGIGSAGQVAWYDAAHQYDAAFLAGVGTPWPVATVLWLRKRFYVSRKYTTLKVRVFMDDTFTMYVNGVQLLRSVSDDGGIGTEYTLPADVLIAGTNVVAIKALDEMTGGIEPTSLAYFDMMLFDGGTSAHEFDNAVQLDTVISNITRRGHIPAESVEVGMMTSPVAGYAIGTQTSGANALGPLLKAHFAYMSEYDGKLNFKFMGADAALTIDENDLVDTGDSAVVETQRENATEYPRRIIAQYYDVDQNFMPATVTATRTAAGVAGSGDQGFDIPVAMSASQAQQAVDKAMKAAYAALDGSVKITVPFATRNGCYLRLVAGDAVLFRGRRWIITRETLGAQTLALEMQADRQSAYTSNVQAVPGRPVIAPESRYSGPTAIVPMSLPPLRSQDSPGIYAVTYSDPFDAAWKVANVQMSLDVGATWQHVGVSTIDGDVGALTQPDGGTSLTVQMRGDLSSVTVAQLDANQNAVALIHADTIEVLQFGTATEDETTPHLYTLTDLRRHQAKTAQVTGAVGDQFVPLKAATFVPVNVAFAGQTLLFRAVGYGEKPDDAVVASVVYNPAIPDSDPMGALQTEGGDYIMTEAGDYLLTS